MAVKSEAKQKENESLHPAVRYLDPLALQPHQLPRNMIVSRLADILDDSSVEDRLSQRLDEERADVLGWDEGR